MSTLSAHATTSHDRAMPPERRRALGAFYTPGAVVDIVLDAALRPALDEACASRDPVGAIHALRVLDPSCGEGNFLLRVAETLAARLESLGVDRGAARSGVVACCVAGADIDAGAAERCRDALASFGGVAASSLRERVRVDDALSRGPALFGERFDAVVGNPPYLNQLESATVSSRSLASAVRAWSGGAVGGYADAAAAFWMLSVMLTRDGGRVGLVLPAAALSTRDARAVRGFIASRCSIESVWFSRERVFDASVHVCAPVVRVGGDRIARVVREEGLVRAALRVERVCMDSLARAESWSRLLPAADGIPAFGVSGGSLGDIARATADFRDQYYGLEGVLLEDEDARRRASGDELERRFPRLITSGLIEPGRSLWGSRATRVHKRSWRAPRVDLARLERETSLGPWARSRLTPKVLLATQTRVLECVVDERGEWLPCVPVITVTPRAELEGDPGALRRIAAAISSPAATAFAVREFGGAALSADAIKLAARQVLALPLGCVEGEAAVASWHRARATLE